MNQMCVGRSTFPEILLVRDPAELARFEIAPGLGAFFQFGHHHTELVRRSLGMALRIPGGEVAAAVVGGTVVGYLLLQPAGLDQPWGCLGDRRIMEIGIEVARGHRGQGVARSLFAEVFARPEVEARIYVATAYVWCWDLAEGPSALTYAERLLGLFTEFGFRREWTSEPNVALAPCNFLAVRIGGGVPPDLLRRFRAAQRGDVAA